MKTFAISQYSAPQSYKVLRKKASPSIREAFSLLFTFECLFVLFLNAGEFQIYMQQIPALQNIHATLLTFGINLIAGTYIIIFVKRLKINDHMFHFFLIFLIFCAYICLSYIKTVGQDAADQKFQELGVIIWTVFAGCFIVNNSKRINNFNVLYIAFSSMLSIVFIWQWANGEIVQRQLIGVFSEQYHRLGRSAGYAIVMCTLYYMFGKSIRNRLFFAVVVATNLIALILSAHRAPFIALIGIFLVICFLFLIPTFKKNNFKFSKKAFFLIIIGVMIVSTVLFSFSSRAQHLLRRYEYAKVAENTRIELYAKSIEVFFDHPLLGVGFGGFTQSTGFIDKRHPHNILIEILLELGILGFIPFIIFMTWWHFRTYSYRHLLNDKELSMMFFAYLYFFINAMISGDITDNRILILFVCLLTANSIKYGKRV